MKTLAQPSLHVFRFPQPTLLLIANHERGDVWQVDREVFKHLVGIRREHKKPNDKKGAHVDTDSGYVHASFGHGQEEELKKFIATLAAKSSALLKDTNVRHLYLVVPRDIARPLIHKLPLVDQKKVSGSWMQDLTKRPFADIVHRLRSQLFG